MSQAPSPIKQPSERTQRLAKALRENLLKRKQQQRERITHTINEPNQNKEIKS